MNDFVADASAIIALLVGEKFDGFEPADLNGTLISSLIEARYGRCVAEIQQDVHAVNVSQEMADLFRVAAGSAALQIVRRYIDSSGVAFEVSVSLHPAERFSVSMRLRRSPVSPKEKT